MKNFIFLKDFLEKYDILKNEKYSYREFLAEHYISKKNTTIDYGITTATGASNYIVNNQLVTYGKINFKNDASLIDVMTPSRKVEYARINSICDNPKIRFKNMDK